MNSLVRNSRWNLFARECSAILCCLLICLGCQPSEPTPAKLPTEPQHVPANAERSLPTDSLKQADVALANGLNWLLSQQAEDGGWHSQTYGPFKWGAATTSLVLYAASQLPPELRQQHMAAWLRGWKFLEPGVRKKGFVVCPDGTMDEPVYATALVLIAAPELELNINADLLRSMRDFLWEESCGKGRGFAEDDPNFGGWDLAGGTGLQAETPGSNISITRFAIKALKPELPQPKFPPAILAWAKRVQNLSGDGGFYFHPQRDHEGNKAQWADGDAREKPRSYGTATCDGVLLLAALGVKPDNAAFQAGVQWLVENPAVDHVPGFEDAPPEIGWQQGLRFYYWMTLAQTLRYLPADARAIRRQAILEQLISRQHADGYWQNESARMREDDLLIATSFALVALSELLK